MFKETIRKLLIAGASLTALSAGTLSAQANANSDILFILDGSGSMWGQIDGVAKIDTAKKTLTKMLGSVPEDARLGLMTYGTTDKTSCKDVSYANPIGSERSELARSINELKPLGKTPIDLSLSIGIAQLSKTEPTDVQKSVVLISDGIETCDGDPCNTALQAKADGISMKVHVVGFNVDQEARNQLECIAENGGGQYFDADDTAGFQTAVDTVVKVAQAKVEPIVVASAPEPTTEVFFRDGFDGEALSEDWTMTNEDEEAYIVEEGELLLVSAKPQGLNSGEPTNLLQLNKKMPKGNWDMNLKLKLDAQTARDQFYLGLYKDPQNFIASRIYVRIGNPCGKIVIQLDRYSKGERAFSEKNITGLRACGDGPEASLAPTLESMAEEGIVLTLSKRGRSYTASATLNGIVGDTGTPKKVTTDELTSLRLPGPPALMIGKWENRPGEVLSFIDEIEIVKVK